MSRVLYFDCFSGISGDMVLGAFLDAGLPLDELKRALGSLSVSGFDVSTARVLRAGVSATKFIVHEVGALDSIIDIVGAVFAMEWVGADRIVCSPLNVGGGTVHSAHGVYPVPAPATLKLLGDALGPVGHLRQRQ